jgi:DNA repair exonuclease SbcCD ATPase subunit
MKIPNGCALRLSRPALPRSASEAVEKLLGLKYDDFLQCVVLPQGQFAAFLHAKPTERQDILLRLLGAVLAPLHRTIKNRTSSSG